MLRQINKKYVLSECGVCGTDFQTINKFRKLSETLQNVPLTENKHKLLKQTRKSRKHVSNKRITLKLSKPDQKKTGCEYTISHTLASTHAICIVKQISMDK